MALFVDFIKDSKVPAIFSIIILLVGSIAYFSFERPEGTMIRSQEAFLNEMVMHHEEAVSSARSVATSENNELAMLAQNIISSQEAEIEKMNSLIEKLHRGSNYKPTYMEMMPQMTGLNATERDQAFIRGMIMHHETAIRMSTQVLELDNIDPEVKDLAQTIIRDQTEEIQTLKNMLNGDEAMEELE